MPPPPPSSSSSKKIAVTRRLARAVQSFEEEQAAAAATATSAGASGGGGDGGAHPVTTTIDVQWKPFQIDPGTAEAGEKVEAYCRRRWGGSGWTRDLRRHANFGDWQWWPHTARAHQWVRYGRERHGCGDSDRLHAVLFEALYEKGANLSLTETLVELGRQEFPHCDAEALREYLQNNQGLAEVQREIALGRSKYNIRGVPYFVVGAVDSDRPPYGFSGAQPSGTFTEIFRELAVDSDG